MSKAPNPTNYNIKYYKHSMVKFISREKYHTPQNIMHRLYKYFTIYNIKDMTDITLHSFQYIYKHPSKFDRFSRTNIDF